MNTARAGLVLFILLCVVFSARQTSRYRHMPDSDRRERNGENHPKRRVDQRGAASKHRMNCCPRRRSQDSGVPQKPREEMVTPFRAASTQVNGLLPTQR